MKKPNIVIILCDQLSLEAISGYREIYKHEAYLAHWVNTPNLDRMIKEGYSFLNSHASNPVSSPCRSSIFTGRYSIETGVIENQLGIDQNVPNMGQWFESKTNYKRVYCGKWHAGGQWAYPDIKGPRIIPGFDVIPVGVKSTGDFTDYQVSHAIKSFLLNYKEENPFLVVAGLMNPHDIVAWAHPIGKEKLVPRNDLFRLGANRPPLPPNFNYDYDDPYAHEKTTTFNDEQWKNYIYDYCRMVERLDADVGRILNAVDARGDQTLVFFLSDHGEGVGRHKRLQKWHPFEESVKVPLIVYMPGVVKANVLDVEHIVSSVDIMTTVCDYAGIPAPPHSRGISLRGLLEQQEGAVTKEYDFIEFKWTARIVRKGDFKYVKYYEYSGDPEKPFIRISDGQAEQFIPGPGALRYKVSDTKLLFNLKEDPWELTNLALDPAYDSKIEELDTLLATEYESKIIPGTPFNRN